MTTLDEVLGEIARINESIQNILADIKSNTGKANIQTTDDNKVKLKQIESKLKQLQKDMLSYYHPKNTIQETLPIFNSNKKLNKQLIKRNF